MSEGEEKHKICVQMLQQLMRAAMSNLECEFVRIHCLFYQRIILCKRWRVTTMAHALLTKVASNVLTVDIT
jgi:hypothetical protein